MIRAFIQARMSSRRFPGKVLAPLAGRPVIARVIDSVAAALPRDAIVVLTSVDGSDDPLAAYVSQLGVAVFRGPLDNVFERFRAAARAYPCDWFVRLSADSPLLDPPVVATALRLAALSEDADLVTNVHPRTFPKGMSVEVVRTSRFVAIDAAALDAAEREHVTRCYYARPEQFQIRNFAAAHPDPDASLAVDSLDDLERLARMLAEEAARR